MKRWLARRRAADLGRLDEELAGLGMPLALADRACCCPGHPAFRVILPPARGRPRAADLLLCRHHYRVSRATLRAAGATVYDEAGTLVRDHDDSRLAAIPPPAAAAGRARR